ncbi:chemotaxis protein CheA [Desulfovibrio mangrovi]|uniref:chemotaxis protein CheA n=1 Tax=Desulfovibrio mangrovi TaxID=2976983 RepID=UPI002245298A|nr:chemotaxis protein CheA [Desulfovibrio mangrovi]UZP68469.1 chemotaxis protein CheA [Desulfovibrio mangrovi]
MLDDVNAQAFREEAQELLAELETALLELEEAPDNSDIVDRVFRAMHTIKGSGAMFGFDDIAAFTHDVENVFDKVRNGELSVTRELLDLTLKSRDHIAHLLECSATGAEVDTETEAQLTAQLKAMMSAVDLPEEPETEMPGPVAAPAQPGVQCAYRIRFKPARDIFLSGSNPLHLLDDLSQMGAMQCFPHFGQLPGIEELDVESCYVWWDILLLTDQQEEAIRDVFLFVEDDCELTIRAIDSDEQQDSEVTYKRLGEILLERGDISHENLVEVLKEQRPIGRALREAGLVTEEQIESALAEQQTVRELRKTREVVGDKSEPAAASIRVAADKLDKLVDLVGELVIVQAQIAQYVHSSHDSLLMSLSEELERLSDELRDSTLSIRMLPIGTTFSKFRRLIRDLSSELGKEVELVTYGAETELDKTVIERLGDPLVHCLRNSLDHGIEKPDVRAAAGKSRCGTITLAAEHSGGEVLISIVDDGAGLNRDRIRASAVSKGIINSEAELTDKEICNLIFAPGFSTAAEITSVSGRGVGMDVVKRSIDALRGTIELDSSPGAGTTITIRLPLTLAIIDGLQVQVGNEFYVIPLNHVEECVEHIGSSVNGDRQRIINLRGEIVPYITLREQFEVPGFKPQIEQIVVVSTSGARYGIVVDHVIGEHQTVIKSLGKVYKDVEGISGATIKGDGSMALILDIPRLVQSAIVSQRHWC